jgi:ubiquinone/menaquinone biosynthesis C-methylase UbiE
MKKTKLQEWKKTQINWDDYDFLLNHANSFMKMRWRRLDFQMVSWCQAWTKKCGFKANLLDVGCGHAGFFKKCKEQVKFYTGIEPSKKLLPKNKKLKGGMLLQGVAEKLPVKNCSQDLVLMKEILDHCFDPLKAIVEAYRVLRPGGEINITLTNDQSWYKWLFSDWARRIKLNQTDHLYFFAPEKVKALAQAAGFEKVEVISTNYLRLPGLLENSLGGCGDIGGFLIMDLTDSVGSLLFPEAGGSFQIRGVKNA